MSVIDTEAKRKQLKALGAVAFVAVIGAVTAPFAIMAVEGLIGWIVAGGIVVVAANFAPVFGVYVANKRIQALVAVVEANPIETMQSLFVEKSEDLSKADANIADFETEIRNFDDQIGGFKKQYPEEAPAYIELSGKMQDALLNMKQQQTAARRELANFEQQINKAKAIYRMTLAAQRVVKLSKSAEADVFAHIKEQVAFDAVRTSLNRAFSNLNLALERRQDAKAFAADPPKALAEPMPAELHKVPTPTQFHL